MDDDAKIVSLAGAVLTMAANGGMPDTFWHTDYRILMACDALGMVPHEAREWAEEHKVVNA